jgi:uncharacterized protein YjbI with pentapeptide repeats
MANAEHVALLLDNGVAAWNAWREKNPNIRPDLSGVTLVHVDRSGANLSGANLSDARFVLANVREANLKGANLKNAALIRADLGGSNLSRAELKGAFINDATLTGADLSGASLQGAKLNRVRLVDGNLQGADLSEVVVIETNLHGANLQNARLYMTTFLHETDLSEANLSGVDLSSVSDDPGLRNVNFSGADLSKANLSGLTLVAVSFQGADLSQATLVRADLSSANLSNANLQGALLVTATLMSTKLVHANLCKATFYGALLSKANLGGADLRAADLRQAALVESDLSDADLTGCRVYGVSAWDLKLEGATQQNLVITPENEPEITVDDIEVAQFIYLMLHNQKIRDVIDTITSKAVLILGRFTDERKAVLDALREELRKHNYLPILFDFDVPATRDITETISLLARMARFIVADLTDPSSIPKELEAIVPSLAVPVQPLLEGASRPYSMFKDYWKYDWVLPVYRYEGLGPLLASLAEKVIAPAEGKVRALEERRRLIEAELTKPQ